MSIYPAFKIKLTTLEVDEGAGNEVFRHQPVNSTIRRTIEVSRENQALSSSWEILLNLRQNMLLQEDHCKSKLQKSDVIGIWMEVEMGICDYNHFPRIIQRLQCDHLKSCGPLHNSREEFFILLDFLLNSGKNISTLELLAVIYAKSIDQPETEFVVENREAFSSLSFCFEITPEIPHAESSLEIQVVDLGIDFLKADYITVVAKELLDEQLLPVVDVEGIGWAVGK